MNKLLLGSLLLISSFSVHAIDLRPTAVFVDIQHLSHVSEHFGANQSNLGAEIASLGFRYDFSRLHFTVKEGSSFGSGWQSIKGPREIFQAQISYDIWRK